MIASLTGFVSNKFKSRRVRLGKQIAGLSLPGEVTTLTIAAAASGIPFFVSAARRSANIGEYEATFAFDARDHGFGDAFLLSCFTSVESANVDGVGV
jgi:hypothetical protein